MLRKLYLGYGFLVLSSAAFARISAVSALGASAVTCTIPVNAGVPVDGSSR